MKDDNTTGFLIGSSLVLTLLGLLLFKKRDIFERFPELGRYFNWNEFTRSQIATQHNLEQQFKPEERHARAGIMLARTVLDPLRSLTGSIRVNSWWRSEQLNNKLIELGYPAAVNSTHKRGGTADVVGMNNSNRMLALTAVQNNLPFDRMLLEFPQGNEPEWIQFEIDPSKSSEQQRGLILEITSGTSGNYLTRQQFLNKYS